MSEDNTKKPTENQMGDKLKENQAKYDDAMDKMAKLVLQNQANFGNGPDFGMAGGPDIPAGILAIDYQEALAALPPIKEISVVPGVPHTVFKEPLFDLELGLLAEGIEQQYIDQAKMELGYHRPIGKPLTAMTQEELVARNKEVSQRQRRTTSDTALAMPTTQEVNDLIFKSSANYEGQPGEEYTEPHIQGGVAVSTILLAIERQKLEKEKRLEEMKAAQEARRKEAQSKKAKTKVPWYKKFMIAYTARFLAWLVR
jgi:hypothetical protein